MNLNLLINNKLCEISYLNNSADNTQDHQVFRRLCHLRRLIVCIYSGLSSKLPRHQALDTFEFYELTFK